MDRSKSSSVSSLPERAQLPTQKRVRAFNKNFSFDQVSFGSQSSSVSSLPDSPKSVESPEVTRKGMFGSRTSAFKETDRTKSSSVTCLTESSSSMQKSSVKVVGAAFTPATRDTFRAKSSSVSTLQEDTSAKPIVQNINSQNVGLGRLSQSLKNVAGSETKEQSTFLQQTNLGGANVAPSRLKATDYVVPPLPTTAMRQQQLREQQAREQQQQQHKKVSRWNSNPDNTMKPKGSEFNAPPLPTTNFAPQQGVSRWGSVPDSVSKPKPSDNIAPSHPTSSDQGRHQRTQSLSSSQPSAIPPSVSGPPFTTNTNNVASAAHKFDQTAASSKTTGASSNLEPIRESIQLSSQGKVTSMWETAVSSSTSSSSSSKPWKEGVAADVSGRFVQKSKEKLLEGKSQPKENETIIENKVQKQIKSQVMVGQKTNISNSTVTQAEADGKGWAGRVGKLKVDKWENAASKEEVIKEKSDVKRIGKNKIDKWETVSKEDRVYENTTVINTEVVKMRNKEKREKWENLASGESIAVTKEREERVKRLSKEQILQWDGGVPKAEEGLSVEGNRVKRLSKVQCEKWEAGMSMSDKTDEEKAVPWKDPSTITSQVRKEITKFEDGGSTGSPCDSREASPPPRGVVRRSSSGLIKKTLAAFEQGLPDRNEAELTPSPGLRHSSSGLVKKNIAAFADMTEPEVSESSSAVPLRHSNSGIIKMGLAKFEGQGTPDSPADPEATFLEKRRSFHDAHTERFSALVEKTEQGGTVQSVSLKIPVDLLQAKQKRPQSLAFYPANTKPEPATAANIPWGKEPKKRQTPSSITPNAVYAQGQYEASMSPESAEKKRREIAAFFQQSSQQITHKLEQKSSVVVSSTVSKTSTDHDELADSWEELLQGTELDTSIDQAFSDALLKDLDIVEDEGSPGSESHRRAQSEGVVETSDDEMSEVAREAKTMRSQTFQEFSSLVVEGQSVQSQSESENLRRQVLTQTHCLSQQAVGSVEISSTSEGQEVHLSDTSEQGGEGEPRGEGGDDSSSEASLGMSQGWTNSSFMVGETRGHLPMADQGMPKGCHTYSRADDAVPIYYKTIDEKSQRPKFLSQISFTLQLCPERASSPVGSSSSESLGRSDGSDSEGGFADEEDNAGIGKVTITSPGPSAHSPRFRARPAFLIPKITVTDLDAGAPSVAADNAPPKDGNTEHFLAVSDSQQNVIITRRQNTIAQKFFKGDFNDVYADRQRSPSPSKERKTVCREGSGAQNPTLEQTNTEDGRSSQDIETGVPKDPEDDGGGGSEGTRSGRILEFNFTGSDGRKWTRSYILKMRGEGEAEEDDVIPLVSDVPGIKPVIVSFSEAGASISTGSESVMSPSLSTSYPQSPQTLSSLNDLSVSSSSLTSHSLQTKSLSQSNLQTVMQKEKSTPSKSQSRLPSSLPASSFSSSVERPSYLHLPHSNRPTESGHLHSPSNSPSTSASSPSTPSSISPSVSPLVSPSSPPTISMLPDLLQDCYPVSPSDVSPEPHDLSEAIPDSTVCEFVYDRIDNDDCEKSKQKECESDLEFEDVSDSESSSSIDSGTIITVVHRPASGHTEIQNPKLTQDVRIRTSDPSLNEEYLREARAPDDVLWDERSTLVGFTYIDEDEEHTLGVASHEKADSGSLAGEPKTPLSTSPDIWPREHLSTRGNDIGVDESAIRDTNVGMDALRASLNEMEVRWSAGERFHELTLSARQQQQDELMFVACVALSVYALLVLCT